MPNRWYALVMGEQIGPLSDAGLRELVAKKQLTTDDMVRKEPAAKWVPAARVRGLFPQVTVETKPHTIPPTPVPIKPDATPVAGSVENHPAPEFREVTTQSLPHLMDCPDCGKRISRNAGCCPNCGHAFFRPSRSLAILLAGFLGGIGIHKFYLRRPGDGFVALLFCWTFIPAIWALIESFQYLSMDDETFVSKFGNASIAKAASQPQLLEVSSRDREPAKRSWIAWTVAAFVALAIIGALSSDSEYRRVTPTNNSQVADTSHTRPTLHDKTALDWQSGSYDDKLATCTFFLWGLWQNDALKPHIQNSIHSIEDLKPYARELVVCIDAATRPEPNSIENKRVFSQFKVHDIAAAGIVTMGWGH